MKFFHKSHRQHRRNRQSIFKRERAKMKQIIIIVSLVAILMCQVRVVKKYKMRYN